MLRTVLLALAPALVSAAPASAAEVSLRVPGKPAVRLGSETRISGKVTELGLPLAGRRVVLQVRRHPFAGAWKRRAATRTLQDGAYAFSPRLDRNHDVRALLTAVGPDGREVPGAVSPVVRAFVLPAFTLTFAQRPEGAVRITQVYSVPRDVRLSAPTRFYVGRRSARRLPLREVARTRRVRPGRYVARATVSIPEAYDGRFAYVSCFTYSRGSGMGPRDLRCPERRARR
jgi:hypothetical protein